MIVKIIIGVVVVAAISAWAFWIDNKSSSDKGASDENN